MEPIIGREVHLRLPFFEEEKAILCFAKWNSLRYGKISR
jgi:hypothetical protein